MEAEPIVRLRSLWKVFGPHPEAVVDALAHGREASSVRGRHTVAVRDVSLDVYPGEIFIVMGLSGSGKSTLVRLMNRLVEATAGTVEVAGMDVMRLRPRELRELRRSKIAMVFQRFGLLPHRSVLDNVAFGLEVQGVPRRERTARAEAAIALVGLSGWEAAYPHQLSGGMQQRVGLARALTADPEILLMDEPFSALDPLIRRRLQDELLEIQERLGKTIVFVTHDLDEALKLGSRVAIMREGAIVQVGSPEDILLRPADDYVRAFVEGVDRSKVLRAKDVMFQPETTLRTSHSPRVALRVMESEGLSSLFALAPPNRLAGLVTADAALEAARRGDRDLARALVRDIPTASPETLLRDLIPLAAGQRYPIPIVDADGTFLGAVARVSLLRGLAEEAPPAEAEAEGVAARERVEAP
ncbi:MAG: glycine betaine/L-proline ABC transporter ATP-binding protein [Clostridia bacterium]|nr:glycine betaine/L-proline ABC transporter ATP-binding protein [Clostridia bacterium]